MASGYDGLVIAGGGSRRMGGGDKTALAVSGRPMRAAALAALARASRTIVVGPGGDLVEDPPGAGPLAAVAAGLARVESDVVVVLAADLPFVTSAAVEQLVAAAPAVATDDHGRAQYLLAAYRSADLRAVMPADPAGKALHPVIVSMAPNHVELIGSPPPWWDCDTPEDLDRARMWS